MADPLGPIVSEYFVFFVFFGFSKGFLGLGPKNQFLLTKNWFFEGLGPKKPIFIKKKLVF